jgi:murein DD-endopeptidase MepM/ murein hydrolase activator NlpD
MTRAIDARSGVGGSLPGEAVLLRPDRGPVEPPRLALATPAGGPMSRHPRPRTLMGRRFRRLSLAVLVPLLVGVLGAPTPQVGADELSDARARQAALSQQLQDQKTQIAKINALQADLNAQIDSTRSELSGINANLTAVRASITSMVAKINVVQAQYDAQVAELAQLDAELVLIEAQEVHLSDQLAQRKALLAERIQLAYDTNRTSLLETFLSSGSFTDVLSEVSYSIDAGEQDRALAEQIVQDQTTLAAVHQTVQDTRTATDALRVATAAQKAKLDTSLAELKSAQAELKRLEAATKKALAIQQAAYTRLAANKHNLAKALAATAAARSALANKIEDLVAQQYQLGNIPSQYNGTLRWPMAGIISQEFGCTGVIYEPADGSCSHFHHGIDIVSESGCGAPIRASGTGSIAYIGWNYADGADPAWIVIIAHASNLTTWYAHMKAYAYPGGIRTGSVVKAGQVIGYEDTTGHSTGCHLHWAVMFNGTFANPRLFV